MSSGGGGGGGQNTVTQVQQVPEYVQAESKANQDIANSLAAQAYPTYQGQLIQPFTDLQNAGIDAASNYAGSFQPYLNQANAYTLAANPVGASQGYMNQGMNQLGAGNQDFYGATGAAQTAQGLTNPWAVSAYMSPYVQASIAPQLSDLQIANAQQQNQINAAATQAGAFGDARQGAAQALQNYYTNQSVNQLSGQAYQNAFTAANQALANAQSTNVQAANAYNQAGQGFNTGASIANQLANTGLQQQAALLSQGQQEAGLGGLQQQYGLNAANALYGAGAEQQQQLQTELNTAYQQYLNQVNWPFQMLNVRESAISNNPYNIQTATTLPAANTTAQGFGAVTSLAGLANNLTGGKA